MRYGKLLMLGVAAIISANALAMPIQAEQSIHQLTEQVQMLQQNNIIPKIDVNYIIKPAQEINSDRVVAEARISIASENCTVDINVTPDMKVSYSGTTENREALKEITGVSNQNQENLRTSYLTYHETSHCKMYEVKEPFKADNKDAEKALNQFFQFSGTSYGSKHGDTGLYYILHENFADTFAYMQLIKNHGVGKDVMETMQKIQIERSDASNTYNKNGIIAHNTEFSLKEVLKEENLKKIMATDNPQQLEQMALQIANKGMWQSIRTHGSIEQVVNSESLENGAMFLFTGLMHRGIELNEPLAKNINLHLEDNMLYKAAQETKEELGKKFDLGSIKNQDQMKVFLQANSDLIKQTLQEKFDLQLTKSIENGLDPLTAIENYAATITPGAKMSLEQIKTTGAEAVKNIEGLSNKLSMESVLKNMNSIRNASLNDTNRVHVKYNM